MHQLEVFKVGKIRANLMYIYPWTAPSTYAWREKRKAKNRFSRDTISQSYLDYLNHDQSNLSKQTNLAAPAAGLFSLFFSCILAKTEPREGNSS